MAHTFNVAMIQLSKVFVGYNGLARAFAIKANEIHNSTIQSTPKDDKKILKSVFISQSNDVFTNLALEDWFYRNHDFTNHQILLLWKNSPCVVIGRHQNPWLESNITNLAANGIEFARRNSGGGTVYHDNGNLNLTFFTPKERYNRKNNLELITRALFREYAIRSEVTPREDIVVNGKYKISGTASKLGRPNAYHHCTLLVDVNKVNLKNSLINDNKDIQTNATRSIPSPVINLKEVNRSVKIDKLLAAIGWEYLRTCPVTMEDKGPDMITQQGGFQMINPTEYWFPGIDKLREDFHCWNWRFGKTPKFEIHRTFRVPIEFIQGNSDRGLVAGKYQELKISMLVMNGVIEDITMTVPEGLAASGFHGQAEVVSSLRGRRFSEDAIICLENQLCSPRQFVHQEKHVIADNMKQMMQAV